MTENLRGALFMVLAMLGFGIEDAMFKAATATVSPGLGTVIFGLTAMGLSVLVALRAGVPVVSGLWLRRAVLVRTAFEILGRLFFALALAYTPLSTTSAILQAAPLVVMLGAALFMGERIGPRRWLASAVGFAGVMLILRPGAAGFDPSAIFAVLGMIGFAGRDLATRASPAQMHHAQLSVLGFAVVTVAGIVILGFEGTWPAAPDARAWALLLATGGVGVLAYTCITFAMRTGDVAVVAPFRYFRLLVALGIAYVMFRERPDAWMLAGATLIVGSGLYTLWREARGRRPAAPPPREDTP